MLGAACNSSSAVPRLPPAVFYNNRDVCAAAHQVCSVAPEALADICSSLGLPPDGRLMVLDTLDAWCLARLVAVAQPGTADEKALLQQLADILAKQAAAAAGTAAGPAASNTVSSSSSSLESLLLPGPAAAAARLLIFFEGHEHAGGLWLPADSPRIWRGPMPGQQQQQQQQQMAAGGTSCRGRWQHLPKDAGTTYERWAWCHGPPQDSSSSSSSRQQSIQPAAVTGSASSSGGSQGAEAAAAAAAAAADMSGMQTTRSVLPLPHIVHIPAAACKAPPSAAASSSSSSSSNVDSSSSQTVEWELGTIVPAGSLPGCSLPGSLAGGYNDPAAAAAARAGSAAAGAGAAGKSGGATTESKAAADEWGGNAPRGPFALMGEAQAVLAFVEVSGSSSSGSSKGQAEGEGQGAAAAAADIEDQQQQQRGEAVAGFKRPAAEQPAAAQLSKKQKQPATAAAQPGKATQKKKPARQPAKEKNKKQTAAVRRKQGPLPEEPLLPLLMLDRLPAGKRGKLLAAADTEEAAQQLQDAVPPDMRHKVVMVRCWRVVRAASTAVELTQMQASEPQQFLQRCKQLAAQHAGNAGTMRVLQCILPLTEDRVGPAAWLQLVRQLHTATAAAAAGGAGSAAAASAAARLLHVVEPERGLIAYLANDWVLAQLSPTAPSVGPVREHTVRWGQRTADMLSGLTFTLATAGKGDSKKAKQYLQQQQQQQQQEGALSLEAALQEGFVEPLLKELSDYSRSGTATAVAAAAFEATAAAVAAAAAAGTLSPSAALAALLALLPGFAPDDVTKLSYNKRGAAGFFSGGAGSMRYALGKVIHSKCGLEQTLRTCGKQASKEQLCHILQAYYQALAAALERHLVPNLGPRAVSTQAAVAQLFPPGFSLDLRALIGSSSSGSSRFHRLFVTPRMDDVCPHLDGDDATSCIIMWLYSCQQQQQQQQEQPQQKKRKESLQAAAGAQKKQRTEAPQQQQLEQSLFGVWPLLVAVQPAALANTRMSRAAKREVLQQQLTWLCPHHNKKLPGIRCQQPACQQLWAPLLRGCGDN
ncbi:hypothetical protein OEZ86_010115 [Tetradesmus obliquus]|nr:hypothetical protein OEZ86_010115 [Tetradesmus obliquus]